MKFFKAIPIAHAPYIRWAEWAKDYETLQEMGLEDDPLILPDELVPDFEFGICPMKIVSGELVNRSTEELESAEIAYNQNQEMATKARDQIKDINNGKFAFSGDEFPLHDAARARYLAIALDTPYNNTNFMRIDGVVVTIDAGDIPAFLNQFYKGIQLITNVNP